MSVRPIDYDCPTCGREAGKMCIRVGGADRTTFHRGRTMAAVEAARASGAMKPRPVKKKRPIKRFGAFLRLYGPKDAPTHALLVLGHGPEPDTPRGFIEHELAAEAHYDHQSRAIGIGTEFAIRFSGRPRPTLPSYGSATRRILNLIWQPSASRPPLLCAGLRQMTGPQAREVASKLGQRAEMCEHCGRCHVKGKRP